MITPARLTAIDNRAARPAAPHFKKLFFACRLRRLDQANSAAAVIDIVKPRKLDMVRPSTYQAKKWMSRGGNPPHVKPELPTAGGARRLCCQSERGLSVARDAPDRPPRPPFRLRGRRPPPQTAHPARAAPHRPPPSY